MPWKKGQSGNPTGRKPRDKSFKHALSQKVNMDKQVKKLLDLANSKDEAIALKAILAISDRLDGTPIQSLRAHVTDLPKIVVLGRDEALPEGVEEQAADPTKDYDAGIPDGDLNVRAVGHTVEKTV